MFVYVFAVRKKNQVISSKTSDLLEINSKGLHFYIMQFPNRPNCSD